MTKAERSERARKAARVRWSRPRPYPKRVRERILREAARETPEETKKAVDAFMERLRPFLDLYSKRPMD